MVAEGTAMYISEIYANGFRCFGPDTPLTLKLQRGLNILVGPNDSGKTAIIDAPRFLLWTRGDDYVRLEPSDFHVKATGERSTELLIRCTFDSLTPDEEARFLEWCNNEGGTLRLYVCLRGTLRKLAGGGDTVSTQYRAGKDADGLPLEGDLREYLKATYLRPLRDAERELRSGRRSRLSRILGALPDMVNQGKPAMAGRPPTLVDTMQGADTAVEDNEAIQAVQNTVNTTYLDELSFSEDPLTATLGLGAKGSFDQILERLELYLRPPGGRSERVTRGLGYNNLLFMAAELLLLESHPSQIPLLLIEEPEAHLHPQHQTLFMQVLEDRTAPPVTGQHRQQVQVLLTTHSPHLAANADLAAMIMLIDHKAYSLGKGCTKLVDDDYEFLRRFLDATKANLFFARGLIVVEGDAENLLVPAIARKLGRPLGKYGVSMVKVGHRGLFRYSRILQRTDGEQLPLPVALIPDRDIPPDAAKALVGERLTEGEWRQTNKDAHMQDLMKEAGGSVNAFPSEQWTLEFDLARKPELALLVHQAVKLSRSSVARSRQEILDEATRELAEWRADQAKSPDDIAVLIYASLHNRAVSKAVAAEQLAKLIDELPDDAATFRRKLPEYLAKAIDHATRSSTPPSPERAVPADANRVAAP